MSATASLFNKTEQQVIALTASSRLECALFDKGPGVRLWNRFLDLLAPDRKAKPLANERLEALRRLACASLASCGQPAEAHRAAALAAGLTEAQIGMLNNIAAHTAKEKPPCPRPCLGP
jgi:hypothetical protein